MNSAPPPPLKYNEPPTASVPSRPLSIEVLKNGRLPVCDIELEHPSVSRYHAAIQFTRVNEVVEAQLFDLGSSHGTFLNKIPPGEYMPLFEGDMIRLGESSRLMIIHGLTERPEAPMPKSSRAYENSSVAWGMTEQDADDTASGPPTSLLDIGTGESKDSSSSYYHKDPKKALKTWFEAQGYEYEISYQEELIQGDRGFIASIDLPNLDFPLSAAGKGSRKKDAEREACLDACTKLDSRNLLTSTESILTEAEKRKRRNELFGDTEGDDDNFYDRTSNSSKKKGVATLAGRKEKPVTETLSTLTQKRDTARKELDALKAAISKLEEGKNLAVSKDDELDSFMSAMQSAAQEKELKQKRAQIPVLEKELKRLEKLVEIVTPSSMVQQHMPSKTVSPASAPPPKSEPAPPKATPAPSPVFKVPTMASPAKKPVTIKAPVVEAGAQNTHTKTYGLVLPSGTKPAPKRAMPSPEENTVDNKKRRYGAPSRDVSDQELALQSEDVEAAPDTVAGSKSQQLGRASEKLENSFKSIAMTAGFKFEEGDKVLCHHADKMIYEAKIMKRELKTGQDNEDGPYYLVHYKGWKATWDEWLPEESVLVFNPENLAKQAHIVEQVRLQKQAKATAKASDKKVDGGAAGDKTKKRRRESGVDKEEEFMKRPEIRIPIPDPLKLKLVEDWEMVTKSQQLVPLPRQQTVSQVLDDFKVDFYKSQSRKAQRDGKAEEVITEVVEGLKLYFDRALGTLLLYKFERQQFLDLIKEKGESLRMSDVYGAEHLLRLFVQLPTLVAHTNMDQEAVNILRDNFVHILAFLQKTQGTYFLKEYENATPAYIGRTE